MHRSLEGHTAHRYDGELNSLHLQLLELGGLVMDQVQLALKSLQERSAKIAQNVLDREHEVDQLEMKIDNDLVTVIAKRGPVARDLRVIIAISKATTDLERIGDEAARIANLALAIFDSDNALPSKHLMRDVNTMGQQAIAMLHEALDSFDTLDTARAKSMVCKDNDLEIEFQSSLRRLATYLLEDARNVGHAIHTVLMIKSIERVGDHARNLAEYIIYIIQGDDIRHNHAAYCEVDAAARMSADDAEGRGKE
jgi:phosphate transport system protein